MAPSQFFQNYNVFLMSPIVNDVGALILSSKILFNFYKNFQKRVKIEFNKTIEFCKWRPPSLSELTPY